MNKTKVAVIGGGQNCEHEVSLASAASVAAALEDRGYAVLRLTIGTDGTWLDARNRPMGLAHAVALLGGCDAALPIVHGPRGEDGTLAALLDLAGVPYVGSGVRAGALAMDKWATKLVAEALGIATAPGVLVTSLAYVWEGPVVVKPVAAGSASTSCSRSCTVPTAKTAPSRACSTSPTCTTSAPGSSGPRSAWTR